MAIEGTSRSVPDVRGASGDLTWAFVALAGLLLPVGGTATWFDATYNARPEDVLLGVRILKYALVLVGIAGLVLRRIPYAAISQERMPSPRTSVKWILASLIVAGFVLRAIKLDSELWMDEVFLLVRYVPLDVNQLLATYDSQNHQPLYSLMAKAAFVLTGGADWSVRVPAMLLGVASLWAAWWFARRITSETEALLTAAVLAASYHHVWFSQNGRGYTAMLLFTLIATGLFQRLCDGIGHPRRLAWGYAALLALATYTHLTAALIAVGHAVAWLVATDWRSRQARERAIWPAAAIALSGVLTIVLYAPMLPQVFRKLTTPTMSGIEVEWTGASWMLREGLRVLSQGVPGGILTVAVAVVVLTAGIVSYWRQSRLTTLLMFAPVGMTLVAILAARHNLWPRFFFFSAAFLVLAAIRGGFVLVRTFVRWQPERVALTGAAMVAALSLVTVPRAWQPKQQYWAAYEFVERERAPGDDVMVVDIASEVYMLRRWAPTWHRVTSLDLLRETERSARRTWIVFTLPARLRALMPTLYEHIQAPRYQPIRVFPAGVGGAEIYVLRHDPTSGHD